jgi:uncharacterized protein GlcG (DUF336 family)
MTSPTITTPTISLEAAQALLAEARLACASRGFAAAIAITDTGGHLIAFERADKVPFLTVDVAIDKAWTATSFGIATHQWNQYMAEPTVAPLAHHPRLTAIGGGMPLFHEGCLVGGLGVSGGSAVQDHEAAEEALRNAGFLA